MLFPVVDDGKRFGVPFLLHGVKADGGIPRLQWGSASGRHSLPEGSITKVSSLESGS
ncbi:uncharacterized protein METZ01_LOCUS463673, partial [marine metagenome]